MNLNPPPVYSHKVTQRGHEEKNSIQTFPMKNFWESRTLFIKRVLAAGGKVGGRFWINIGGPIRLFFNYQLLMINY
jgi:hypothetical protein